MTATLQVPTATVLVNKSTMEAQLKAYMIDRIVRGTNPEEGDRTVADIQVYDLAHYMLGIQFPMPRFTGVLRLIDAARTDVVVDTDKVFVLSYKSLNGTGIHFRQVVFAQGARSTNEGVFDPSDIVRAELSHRYSPATRSFGLRASTVTCPKNQPVWETGKEGETMDIGCTREVIRGRVSFIWDSTASTSLRRLINPISSLLVANGRIDASDLERMGVKAPVVLPAANTLIGTTRPSAGSSVQSTVTSADSPFDEVTDEEAASLLAAYAKEQEVTAAE